MKKLEDIETIWEFEDLLVELAKKCPLYYAPLSVKYQLLLQRHKTFLRGMLIISYLGGLLMGIFICKLFS